jgi:hypothetical protein
VKSCAISTCSRPAKTKFCSRECQLVDRNRDHCKMLFDLRVGMDLFRALEARAETLNMDVRDLVMNLLEAEVYYGHDGRLFA